MAARARALQLACRAETRQRGTGLQIQCRNKLLVRSYASSPGGAKSSASHTRRAITVTSDDGRYRWSELSTGEKAVRSTQQSFNFVLVVAGVAGTVTVAYFLYQELFAADSKTRQFNHAVDRVKADPRCRELLGPAKSIVAYGEPTSNKWARARPLAHSTELDRFGTSHFRMHFNVEGADGKGVVNVHMTKKSPDDELHYQLLALVVPGHETIYLENANASNTSKSVKKFFGLQLR